MTGLNPHAGEGGLLGTEEETTIGPTLDDLRDEPPYSNGEVELVGPTPAEAAFRYAADGRAHGVVAMFHDQATIPSKLLDWGEAVNVTWGLAVRPHQRGPRRRVRRGGRRDRLTRAG